MRPRKSLGQHFLLDPGICDRIARLAGDLRGRSVLEIGPGPGGLTRALLGTGAGNVVAIEIDPRAVRGLDTLMAQDGRLRVISGDALRTDLASLVEAPRQVVANLPYNVGTPLLVGLLRHAGRWERFTLMFQQEVAERLVAAPGTASYGRLSVLAQWLCAVELQMRLPPGAFVPPPKVWSAVVRLTPRAEQPPSDLVRQMEALTAAAFGQRRKMLRSSLRSLGGTELLAAAGVDPERRAETLDVTTFDTLARLLSATRSTPIARTTSDW